MMLIFPGVRSENKAIYINYRHRQQAPKSIEDSFDISPNAFTYKRHPSVECSLDLSLVVYLWSQTRCESEKLGKDTHHNMLCLFSYNFKILFLWIGDLFPRFCSTQLDMNKLRPFKCQSRSSSTRIYAFIFIMTFELMFECDPDFSK